MNNKSYAEHLDKEEKLLDSMIEVLDLAKLWLQYKLEQSKKFTEWSKQFDEWFKQFKE